MTKLEKRRGQVRIIGSVLATIIILASIKLFIDNQRHRLASHTPVAHADSVVEAPVSAPEPVSVPESIPEPTPAPEPVQAPKPVGDCSLVYNYDWPADIAYQICMKESGGNPGAANWSDNHMAWAGCNGSFGLMQINCSHGQLFDGNENMKVAYSMYKGWGNSFKAWTTCKHVPGCY